MSKGECTGEFWQSGEAQHNWAKVSAELETASATEIIQWAVASFGDQLVLASSFQDAVLLDMTVKVARDIEVVFLDTQYHFPETLDFVSRLERRYGINVGRMSPLISPDDLWKVDLDSCCRARKVEPLRRALLGKAAWMSGLRRSEAPTRSKAPIVSFDPMLHVVKVNAIATWSDDEVAQYSAEHGLPRHPLADQGYRSVGCWPCTGPVAFGEEPRAGRWAGVSKTECGIHSSLSGET